MKRTYAVGLALIALLLGGGASYYYLSRTTEACEDFGKIVYHSTFGVENDNWGSYLYNYSQTTTSCVWTAATRFGWYWNATVQQSHPDYPEIVFGNLDWIKGFSVNPWPLPIAQLTQLGSYASVEQQVHGMWDLAYDIWITDDPNAASKKDHMTNEVMVFMRWDGFDEDRCSTSGETFSDGENTYKYCNTLSSSGWYLHTFAMEPQRNSATVNILKMLQFIQSKGFEIDYIFTVEFGTEFWYGAGNVTVTSYSITLNGKRYR